MQKIILPTGDGSSTISIPSLGVSYHSKHGAIGESRQIFLDDCLRYRLGQQYENPLSVLEIGFGTGLNALLAAGFAGSSLVQVHYTSLETSPLVEQEWMQLNHGTQLNEQELFESLHRCDWEINVKIHPYFQLQKHRISLIDYQTDQTFDCIFFDAFAPEIQPELWTADIFKKLFDRMRPGAVLTTYSSKSIVRKAMQEAGLTVQKIPGPWGKREIVRAKKI